MENNAAMISQMLRSAIAVEGQDSNLINNSNNTEEIENNCDQSINQLEILILNWSGIPIVKVSLMSNNPIVERYLKTGLFCKNTP